MVKVRVENFQSIKKAEIEVNGFTVVTGPNNSGKSALMRAIRGAFTNAPAASYVRHGAKSLSVRLEFDDGQSLEWHKGGRGTNKYVINGHELQNVGRGAPAEVLDMGVFPIKAGGRTLWPQVAPQITGQVFLLDEVGSMVAEAIADVDRVHALNEALKDSESDRRAAVSKIKVRRADEVSLQEEVDMFANLGEAEQLVAALADERTKAQKFRAAIQRLTALRRGIQSAQAEIDELLPIRDIAIPSEEQIEAVKNEARRIRSLEKLRNEYRQTQTEATALKGSIEAMQPFMFLGGGDESLTKHRKAVEVLMALKNRLGDAAGDVLGCQEETAALERELEEINQEIAEQAGHLPECPVCGTLLNESQES